MKNLTTTIQLPSFDSETYSYEELKDQWSYLNQVTAVVDKDRGRILLQAREAKEAFGEKAFTEMLKDFDINGKTLGYNKAQGLITFYREDVRIQTSNLSYPEKQSVAYGLEGADVYEKAQQFEDIKKALGTETPSERDIQAFNGGSAKTINDNPRYDKAREEGEKWRKQKEAEATQKAIDEHNRELYRAYNDIDIQVSEELEHMMPKDYRDFKLSQEAAKMFGDIKGWKHFLRTINKQFNEDNGLTPDKEIIQTLNHIKEYVDMGINVKNAPKIQAEYVKAVEVETYKRVMQLPNANEVIAEYKKVEAEVDAWRKGR